MTTQWTYEGAVELAEALARGEVSAVELARDSIERMEARDGPINAVCVKTYDAALVAAEAADVRIASGERGPLLGVPMIVKESFNLVGTPTTWGIPAARDYHPPDDALAIRRVKAAGAVIVGKTNVPLALGDWQSYNEIYGTTNNPYDLARTPGGSSGGSAAALAAGYAPLSLGTDIGGSLRVPAHFCGVLAHKPTHNLVPPRGHVPPLHAVASRLGRPFRHRPDGAHRGRSRRFVRRDRRAGRTRRRRRLPARPAATARENHRRCAHSRSRRGSLGLDGRARRGGVGSARRRTRQGGRKSLPSESADA